MASIRERFFDATPDLVLVLDASTGEVVEANAKVRSRLGIDLDRSGRVLLADLVNEPEKIVRGWLRRLEERAGGVFECHLETGTRALIPVEVSAFKDTDRFVFVARETAARKQVEDVLQAHARHLRDVLDGAAGPIIVTNRSGVVSFINGPARALIDRSENSPLGRPLEEAPWWRDDRSRRRHVREIVHASANGEIHRMDEEVVDGAGAARRLDLTFQPIRDEHHEISHIVVSGVDVTERELVRTGDVVDAAPRESGVGRLDSRGRWLSCGPRLREILGITDETDAEPIWSCLGTVDEEAARQQFERLVRREVPLFKIGFVTDDGRLTQLSISPNPVERETFDVVVSHEEGGEQGLPGDRSSEQIAQMKASLLANVSHEIRTPMNAVIGLTDVVLDDDLDPRNRRYLEVVRGSARQLMRLLDDILDASTLESGQLQFAEEMLDPRRTVANVVEMFREQVESKGLELRWTCAPEVPRAVIGDEGRIGQVATNLVSNAVKYTDAGEVTVRLGARAEGSESTELVLTVTDTGPGIDPAVQRVIFEPFERAAASDGLPGLGLGLSIVRDLVERMGGSVSVDSELDRGSTFTATMELPTARSDDAAIHGALGIESGVRPLSILAVDDTDANLILVEALLGRAGHRVTPVRSARKALRELERTPFDLVLMDVNMPGIDGLEATRELRAREAERGDEPIPVVAMTAHAMDGDREQCLAAGMSAYVAKPIDVRELLRVVDETGRRLKGPGRGAAECSDAARDGRIRPDEALARLDGDAALLERMVDVLAQDGVSLARTIAEGETVEEAARAAHTLKNQAATAGAAAASHRAARIERDLRAGAVAKREREAAVLESEILAAVEAMRRWLDG